jgi:pyruvate formate lyase activating enzyme
MKISGLQKVSVIDYPGEIACTVFLYGCNFRCGFCYNPDLVVKDFDKGFSEEEVLSFLKNRVGKLDAVCITGGEPLMTLDFDFVKKIKDLGYKIKIDTNGAFPNRLREIIDLGLVDYIAMDIKGAKEKYSEIVNVNVNLDKIEESIKMVHDFGEYEFRTTTVNRLHDAYSLMSMARWLNVVCNAKPKRLFLQGFKANKEGMIDEDFQNEPNVGESFLNELKDCVKDYFENVDVRI